MRIRVYNLISILLTTGLLLSNFPRPVDASLLPNFQSNLNTGIFNQNALAGRLVALASYANTFRPSQRVDVIQLFPQKWLQRGSVEPLLVPILLASTAGIILASAIDTRATVWVAAAIVATVAVLGLL